MDTGTAQDATSARVTGTPKDLARLIEIRQPVRHATYGLADHGRPTLADVLQPFVQEHRQEPVGAGAPSGDRG